MSSTLALSALIARMSHAELRALIGFRRVPSPTNIVDPLGLALEYLRSDSITRAITHLDGDTLYRLAQSELSAAPHQVIAALRERALIGFDEQHDTFVTLPEVQLAVNAALRAANIDHHALQRTPTVVSEGGSPLERTSQPDHLPASFMSESLSTDTSGWFGQAVAGVRISTVLLRALRSEPAKMNRKGIVATAAVRSLADSLSSHPADVAALLNAVQWAGLAAPHPDAPTSTVTRLMVTPAAEQWSLLHYADRWISLAEGVARSIPNEVHATRSSLPAHIGWASDAGLRERYPLLTDAALEHAARCAAAAETLGATVNGVATPTFTALLSGDSHHAAQLAHSEIPAPAAGVYVQPDLTVIVPGPIEADAERILFDVSEVDQLGAAAVLRITQRSLERAQRIGYTTDAIRESLSKLSLTSIPQPLDFILTDLKRERPILNHTSVSTHSHAASWVQKHASNQTLPKSRFTAEDELGVNDSASDPQLELADRVYEAAHLAPGGGDLSRLLELAIRDRHTVQVTAAAGSDVRTFTLLPLAVTAGRLRATDQIAGVERTLPLTAITMVVPA